VGKGRQGEGKEEEKDPERLLHPLAASVAVGSASDELLEQAGAF